MRVSKLGERIVDAGRLLNNTKVEFDVKVYIICLIF